MALALLATVLLGLLLYVHTYDRPFESWLPQGSFRPDDQGRPLGWMNAQRLTVHLGKNSRLSDFHYVSVPGNSAPWAWTRMKVRPGWRLMHLSASFRRNVVNSTGTARLSGSYVKAGSPLPVSSCQLAADLRDMEWSLSEAVWEVPPGAEELRVSIECEFPIDVAEITVIPTYIYPEGRRQPAF